MSLRQLQLLFPVPQQTVIVRVANTGRRQHTWHHSGNGRMEWYSIGLKHKLAPTGGRNLQTDVHRKRRRHQAATYQ